LYRDNEKIASCETYWAVLNTQIRRPENLALPHEHFIKYPEHSATEKSVLRINLDVPFEKITNYKVQLSDLDIVNHANNVKYLEWCLNTMDRKFVIKQRIKGFEMNFLKELNWNDEVIISKNENTFTITKEDKICFALEINE
jgi:acyl-ACP thioesterase